MSKALIMVGVVAIAAAACGRQPASTDAGGTAAGTTPVTVTLPTGDVKAGRQAFMDLKCAACHAVPSEPEFPAPVSANPGPPIDGRLAGRDACYLATAIMSPSHEISPSVGEQVRTQLEGVLSPMGDFSHVMTVRQMVDLHAYLSSIK
jgi:hypothetical protein